MKDVIEELYKKAEAAGDKDPKLRDYLLSLVHRLEDADAMYHHFSYLLMHVRATIAHAVRPPHLQQAIERAQNFLRHYEERK